MLENPFVRSGILAVVLAAFTYYMINMQGWVIVHENIKLPTESWAAENLFSEGQILHFVGKMMVPTDEELEEGMKNSKGNNMMKTMATLMNKKYKKVGAIVSLVMGAIGFAIGHFLLFKGGSIREQVLRMYPIGSTELLSAVKEYGI